MSDCHFTHVAFVRDQKGRISPQLWTEDLTRTKPHTPVRQDLMRHIAASTVKVVPLDPADAQIDLDAAAQKYCPGHVASVDDTKVCAYCKAHADSLR